MRTLILMASLFVFPAQLITAQDIPILFDTNIETYELIENPISVNNGEIWQPESNYSINYNFEFKINGRVFTTLVVNAGIGLTFPGFDPPKLIVWGSEWGGWPFLFDRGTDVSASPIAYEIIGDSGSRILKIQWQNAGIRDNEGDDPDDFVDFQIWVCEGTDRIEVHYGASQTSELSFGYNDGPGVRYLHIDGNWGICVFGFEDIPSWDWVLFGDPYPGCLLSGVPSLDVVYNFFPNSTVSIDNITESNKLDFRVTGHAKQDIKVRILDYKYDKTYKLKVYNTRGISVAEMSLYEESTSLNHNQFNRGMHIFVLMNGRHYSIKKVIL